MLSQREVTLFLLVSFSAVSVNDAAETSTSCPEVACFGQPMNITCDITGVFESIGFSRPDSTEVVTCLQDKGICYTNVNNYEIVYNTSQQHILRIKKFSEKDEGEWNCRDGTNPLLKTCHVKGYEEKQSPTPPSNDCITLKDDGFQPNTLCKGFQKDPNVVITIRVADTSYNFTYDQYIQNDNVPVANMTNSGYVECSVSGPAAQCYIISKPYKNKICEKPIPPWVIVLIVLLLLVIIGFLVDCIYCRKKDKGVSHFVMAKWRSMNAEVTGDKTKEKEEKQPAPTAGTDSQPETKPLLDEPKYANSSVTVVNETEKGKELEPEDKDDTTEINLKDKGAASPGVTPQDKGPAIIEVKGADGAVVKPQDKGANTIEVKPQDKGPAILKVDSEKKEAV